VCRHLNRRTVLEVLGYLLKSQRESDSESVIWGSGDSLHICVQTFKSKDRFRGFEVFGKESEGLRKRYLGIRGFSPYLCADI
jgi:hypothetical protein